MAKFSLWIILYFMVAAWQIVVVCAVVIRNLWIFFLFLSISSFYVDAYDSAVWD